MDKYKMRVKEIIRDGIIIENNPELYFLSINSLFDKYVGKDIILIIEEQSEHEGCPIKNDNKSFETPNIQCHSFDRGLCIDARNRGKKCDKEKCPLLNNNIWREYK